jgi:hypothetical protein
MCRLSLIVTAVTLLLAGSASAAHRAGFWGGRYCLQGQDWGYPAFANSRLISRARRPLRALFAVVGLIPNTMHMRASSCGTDNRLARCVSRDHEPVVASYHATLET